MFGQILLREIKYHILSLRFFVALILIVIVFGFGTIAFIQDHTKTMSAYKQFHSRFIEELREDAESNLTRFAVNRRRFIVKPRSNCYLTDAKEKFLPNRFRYNAYYVIDFDVKPGSANPYLSTFQDMNWFFIISMILSFVVLLFSYDAVSGEKEDKTLAATMSNAVSRGTLLFGKYFSVILTTLFILFPGMCLSLVMILLAGILNVNLSLLGEIVGFLLISILFIGCMTAFGLFASTLSNSSNVSLLIVLVLWLVFVSFVPNTAIYWADQLFPIEKSEVIQQRVRQTREAINNSAPPGSWNSSWGNPFYRFHELRADNQTNLHNAETRIRHAYYNDMFQQYENVQKMTLISPVSLFEYMCEAIVGGGYLRFQNVWQDLKNYQIQLLTYFKDKDANDPDSPHWYNPVEDYSTTRKPVNFSEVPVFEEKSPSLNNRLTYLSKYLTIMLVHTVVIFLITFKLFSKYDLR